MSSQSLFHFCDGVRDEFEGFIRGLLGSIARDYQLKEQELVTRYLTSQEPQRSPVSQALVQSLAPRPPPAAPPLFVVVPHPSEGAKKRGRKPAPGIEALDLSRNLTVDEISACTIPTLKAVCKHHGLKITGSRPELVGRLESWQANPDDPLLKKKKGGRAKRVPGPKEPEHSHPMDDKIHTDCAQCQAYGNPLAPEHSREVFEVAPQDEVLVAEEFEVPPAAPPLSLVSEGDFEIAPAVDPTSLVVPESQEEVQECLPPPPLVVEDSGEIQPASPDPPVQEAQSASPTVPSPVSSPRAELKSKLAALLQDDGPDGCSDSDDESEMSYGDDASASDDEENLSMEGFDEE